MFSTAPLQPELLDWMFENDTSAGWGWEVMASDAWRAYPKLHPHDHAYAPFQLQDGLFYVNAIENAASAMEVRAQPWTVAGVERERMKSRILMQISASGYWRADIGRLGWWSDGLGLLEPWVGAAMWEIYLVRAIPSHQPHKEGTSN